MTAEKKPNPQGTAVPPPRLVGLDPAVARERAAEGGIDAEDPSQEVLQRAQAGDRDAFRSLVEGFQNKVFRLVIRVLKCDRQMAEDLCQEVFLRVHRGLHGFDGQARFGTWLHTIAMNVAISEYRKRRALKRNRATVSLDAPIQGTDDLGIDPPAQAVDPGERAHQREFLARVRACVQELPDEFRQAVVLRDMQGMSYEEVSEVLGVPAGTVRSRIHRGRLLLQQKLKGFLS